MAVQHHFSCRGWLRCWNGSSCAPSSCYWWYVRAWLRPLEQPCSMTLVGCLVTFQPPASSRAHHGRPQDAQPRRGRPCICIACTPALQLASRCLQSMLNCWQRDSAGASCELVWDTVTTAGFLMMPGLHARIPTHMPHAKLPGLALERSSLPQLCKWHAGTATGDAAMSLACIQHFQQLQRQTASGQSDPRLAHVCGPAAGLSSENLMPVKSCSCRRMCMA